MTVLDLSLHNEDLYRDLEIARRAGKLTLLTPPEEAIEVLVENLETLTIDPEDVVLTGSMAIWAYLVVFHALHGKTKRIWYKDGRGQQTLVAAHG